MPPPSLLFLPSFVGCRRAQERLLRPPGRVQARRQEGARGDEQRLQDSARLGDAVWLDRDGRVELVVRRLPVLRSKDRTCTFWIISDVLVVQKM